VSEVGLVNRNIGLKIEFVVSATASKDGLATDSRNAIPGGSQNRHQTGRHESQPGPDGCQYGKTDRLSRLQYENRQKK
jgi:hypothetical protein